MGADPIPVAYRIRPVPGRKSQWRIDDDITFILPVLVAYEMVDPVTHEIDWQGHATIDLVEGGHPAVTHMDVRCSRGIDPVHVQRDFRWSTPLQIVTRTVPSLLRRGIDPFTVELSIDRPLVRTEHPGPVNAQLSEDFLEAIAGEYLAHGRGYAKTIAAQHDVSERTVVNWVEKARWRGILSRVKPGSIGGHIIPTDQRNRATKTTR